MNNLQIPVTIWWRLLSQLKERGRGERESGAFLLAENGSSRVSSFICYDDLDSTALDRGIVIFHGSGFARLWEICRSQKVRVVADAHTHPTSWTGQSEADRTNPMIGEPGHVALIIPHFAQRRLQSLNGVGIHEYLGNHQWKKWGAKSGRVQLAIL